MKQISVVLLLLCMYSVTAQAQFVEGEHYTVVSETKTKEPTVTEFFSLFCSHCFQYEPMFQKFASGLPEGVSFEKSHVTYMPRDNEAVGNGIVQAFIAMEKLGKRKELTEKFFNLIHIGQKQFASMEDVKAVFIASGVSAEEFDAAYNDKEVVAAAKVMQGLWEEKQIASVPSLLVNGKYLIRLGKMKDFAELDRAVRFLLEK